jgi:hypothetical protein
MDQAIFNFGLSTQTISVYLMCCGLADMGNPVTVKAMLPIWSGSEEELRWGLTELEARHIIEKEAGQTPDLAPYRINPASKWRLPAS